MFYAKDVLGNTIDIRHADPIGTYFCKQCEREVFIKGTNLEEKPGQRRKHFAHHKAKEGETPCPETTEGRHYLENDMSLWHQEWQQRFPEESREIWRKGSEGWVRADVLLETNKTAIEFQHSPIRRKEWERRNRIYNDLGYTVIWLFDRSEDTVYSEWNDDLEELIPNYRKQFGTYYPQKNESVILFIQYKVPLEPDEEPFAIRRLLEAKATRPKYYGNDYEFQWGRAVALEEFIGFCYKHNQIEKEVAATNRGDADKRNNDTVSEKKVELLSVYDWFQRCPKAKRILLQNAKTNRRFWIYRKNLPRRGREVLFGYEIRYPYPNEWKEVYYSYEPQWRLVKFVLES